ncbi:hypothetical protein IWQ60_012178, partial [Tieghemiomyces parasiticus]
WVVLWTMGLGKIDIVREVLGLSPLVEEQPRTRKSPAGSRHGNAQFEPLRTSTARRRPVHTTSISSPPIPSPTAQEFLPRGRLASEPRHASPAKLDTASNMIPPSIRHEAALSSNRPSEDMSGTTHHDTRPRQNSPAVSQSADMSSLPMSAGHDLPDFVEEYLSN